MQFDKSTFLAPFGMYCFDMIARDHLCALVYATRQVPPFLPKFLVRNIPRYFLERWLSREALSIMKDDNSLISELVGKSTDAESLCGLSLDELQFAVCRRGGDPSVEEHHLKTFIIRWLNALETTPSSSLYSTSLLAHACALPETVVSHD